ncbi:MAG: (2Fe-2S)-binding protein [Longimicrobiales bacterium]|nr:(2Fe-2S)-binding protein [Longimicrobiales bacterium]
MPRTIRFTLNGQPTELDVDPGRTLLWVIRSDLGLTGTKYGCGESHCGACTVLIDGRAVPSCIMPASSIEGREVTTIEGLAGEDGLAPIQQAFLDHGALQCGFCTPGMILGAQALLLRNPDPTDEEIRSGMERHLCRCGTHLRVVDAIRDVARGGVDAPGGEGGAA